jgi:hypothetical protein
LENATAAITKRCRIELLSCRCQHVAALVSRLLAPVIFRVVCLFVVSALQAI